MLDGVSLAMREGERYFLARPMMRALSSVGRRRGPEEAERGRVGRAGGGGCGRGGSMKEGSSWRVVEGSYDMSVEGSFEGPLKCKCTEEVVNPRFVSLYSWSVGPPLVKKSKLPY